MKNLVFGLSICIFIAFFASCGGKSGGETTVENNTEASIPDTLWNDPYKVSLCIEKYHKEEIASKKKIYFEIEDEIANHLWFLKVSKVNRAELKVMSLGAACVSAKMYVPNASKGAKIDSVDLDFKIIWDANLINPDKSKGNLRVDEIYIQAVNGVKRYTWRQDGLYFERVLIDDVLKQNEFSVGKPNTAQPQ